VAKLAQQKKRRKTVLTGSWTQCTCHPSLSFSLFPTHQQATPLRSVEAGETNQTASSYLCSPIWRRPRRRRLTDILVACSRRFPDLLASRASPCMPLLLGSSSCAPLDCDQEPARGTVSVSFQILRSLYFVEIQSYFLILFPFFSLPVGYDQETILALCNNFRLRGCWLSFRFDVSIF
jgi:hypothetical protein